VHIAVATIVSSGNLLITSKSVVCTMHVVEHADLNSSDTCTNCYLIYKQEKCKSGLVVFYLCQ